ncbi:hypothetical protein UA08_05862 [Talaromyces atroroseus]|uniref:Fe2OG dioxygenase domain-containing protein n=1 Tax=Talaromyces atroroseus TaxID=1441469 RepID=A0A225AZ58_TALAT|nr:hypothetical protein UA08_05862 [Talaromyces atroroseus]OKL58797.1 hypothetical protein UA08_05862 [Talaromyces atroroseus]
MLARFVHLALFLELVSSLTIPTRNKNKRSSTSLNIGRSPYHVEISKVHRGSPQARSKRGYKPHESNSTLIRPTNSNLQYAIEVKFNGIPRYLLLDTGSSDTWMFAEDFKCRAENGTSVPTSQCRIGQPYMGDALLNEGLDETLSIYYGNNENPTGPMGYADVSIAGLNIENQQVALVNDGYWAGDNVLSGVVGVGNRGLTEAFAPGSDVPNLYMPVFESLYNKTGQIDPLFSVALQRGDAGGYLALGGLPPVHFEEDFVTTEMLPIPFGTKGKTRPFYSIQTPGYTLNGKKYTNESFLAVVDTGTYLNRFPTAVADKINAAFNPPAAYVPSYDVYVTSCNATAPQFGVIIEGKHFYMDPADMLVDAGYGICATSITHLLNKLYHALTSVGFLYITNHDVPSAVISDLVDALPKLFSPLILTEKTKEEIALHNSPHFLGYSSVGAETTAGRIDRREQVEYATELDETWTAENGLPLYERLKGPNQWPSEYPELRPVVERYLSELTALSERFLKLVAEALTLPQEVFSQFLSEQHRLKLVHYPVSSSAGDKEEQGVGPHKDSSGWWTFLLQASPPSVKGLQALNREGRWIDVPNIPGTFVVNIGQAFEVVTNGMCKATVHRVVIPSGQGVRGNLTKEEAVGRLREHFWKLRQEQKTQESNEQGADIDSPFLKGKYDTWGESQLRIKIRSHRDVGRKFYGDVYEKYLNDD